VNSKGAAVGRSTPSDCFAVADSVRNFLPKPSHRLACSLQSCRPMRWLLALTRAAAVTPVGQVRTTHAILWGKRGAKT